MKSTPCKRLPYLLLTAILHSLAGHAQTAPPVEVLRFEAGQPVAKAALEQLAWMVGDWQWQGPVDEMVGGDLHFSPAMHGQMLGVARGVSASEVLMNEIITKTQVADSIEVRIRHMGNNLHSWEPLDQPTIHKLVKVDGNTWYFDDYTLVKRDNNHYTLYLRIVRESGKEEIVTVEHTRISRGLYFKGSESNGT